MEIIFQIKISEKAFILFKKSYLLQINKNNF